MLLKFYIFIGDQALHWLQYGFGYLTEFVVDRRFEQIEHISEVLLMLKQ